jgi:hypothetical protein
MVPALAIARDEKPTRVVVWRIAGVDDGGDDHAARTAVLALSLAELSSRENRSTHLQAGRGAARQRLGDFHLATRPRPKLLRSFGIAYRELHRKEGDEIPVWAPGLSRLAQDRSCHHEVIEARRRRLGE